MMWKNIKKIFMWKNMGKRRPHRRGGSYQLYKSHGITNWAYHPMDRACLEKLKIGDTVRVCFLEGDDGFYKRYVRIIRQLSRTHLMGVVEDPYWCNFTCNGCGNSINRTSTIYCCDGDLYNRCNVHVHEACLGICPDCNMVPKTTRIPNNNRSKLVFTKNNIVEIPNWTRNTERLFDQYGRYHHRPMLSACLATVPKN
jgi:hypothetical protein